MRETKHPTDIQKPSSRNVAGVESERSVEQGEALESDKSQKLSISKVMSIEITPAPLVARPQWGAQSLSVSSSTTDGAEKASDTTPSFGFSKTIATDITPLPVQTRSQQPSEVSIQCACWIAMCRPYLVELSAALRDFERSQAESLKADRKLDAARKELAVQERRLERLEAEAEAETSEAAELEAMEESKLAKLKDVAERWLVTALARAAEQTMARKGKVLPSLRMVEKHAPAAVDALHLALLGIGMSLLAGVLFLIEGRLGLPDALKMGEYVAAVLKSGRTGREGPYDQGMAGPL